MIRVTFGDSIWSYFAQLISISSGIVLLPFVLNKLTTDEIAIYYILFSLSSLVTLFDFGFSSQFARNISYVFSGATELKKEGVAYSDNLQIDFSLLCQLIASARCIYKRLALYALLILSIVGSWYLYKVTNGFLLTNNLFSVWILYVVSIYFKIRFLYYNALLMGKGQIRYLQQTTIVYRILYIMLCVLFLFFNCSLHSIVLSDFISLAIQRYLARQGFYTPLIKEKLLSFTVSKQDIQSIYVILWYNAKKIGLTSFAGFLVSQLGLFFAGFYLSLEAVASYGLMCQLVMVISTLSSTLLTIHVSYFASCIVQHRYDELLKRFSALLLIFYVLFGIGTVFLISVIPIFLDYIHSKAFLPPIILVLVYSMIRLLESNHANFATILAANNKIPYMKAALFSGFSTLFGLLIVLKFTNWGLWGVVLVPGIVQGVYQNWKWPKVVCKEYEISYFRLCMLCLKKNV